MQNFIDSLYERERKSLSEYAFLTKNTKGRLIPLKSDGIRTDFQRDRDRILHCKSFRRLTHKTQVFHDPDGDHYRTRLTHSLEVAQIGRTLSRALSLNEDLTEAACLGHDLGHAPFGHAGEALLNSILSVGFRHNEQSLRVVDKLERDFTGLNLTYEVRDGILRHTGDTEAETLEGQIVKFADRIAYINHDIDDAIRAKVLTPDDIPAELTEILGKTHSGRINTMVSSIIFISNGKNYVKMDDKVKNATDKLRDFMFENVYYHKNTLLEQSKERDMLSRLFEYFMKNIGAMPPEYINIAEAEGNERAVCDYITGMTDRFAISTFCEIFVPKTWSII